MFAELEDTMTNKTFGLIVDSVQRARNRDLADQEFCYDIKKRFKPFGLEGPEGLTYRDVEKSNVNCNLENPYQFPICNTSETSELTS